MRTARYFVVSLLLICCSGFQGWSAAPTPQDVSAVDAKPDSLFNGIQELQQRQDLLVENTNSLLVKMNSLAEQTENQEKMKWVIFIILLILAGYIIYSIARGENIWSKIKKLLNRLRPVGSNEEAAEDALNQKSRNSNSNDKDGRSDKNISILEKEIADLKNENTDLKEKNRGQLEEIASLKEEIELLKKTAENDASPVPDVNEVDLAPIQPKRGYFTVPTQSNSGPYFKELSSQQDAKSRFSALISGDYASFEPISYQGLTSEAINLAVEPSGMKKESANNFRLIEPGKARRNDSDGRWFIEEKAKVEFY